MLRLHLRLIFIILFCISIGILYKKTTRSTSIIPSSVKKSSNNYHIETSFRKIKTRSKLSLHPSLHKSGRIIVYHPGMYPHGGSAAMNYLHCGLVTAKFDSFMYLPNTGSIPSECSRSIDINFNLKSTDIVIIAEQAYNPTVASWRSSGARIVVYMLGVHLTLSGQHRTTVLWAPSSSYTRDLYLALGKQILFSPLERNMYEAYQADLDRSGSSSEKNIYAEMKLKENVIVIDGDSNLSRSFITALENLPFQPKVTVKIFSQVPYMEVVPWYRRAKVVIDLGIAGVERVTNEGALFDAIVLVGNTLNGIDPNDYPFPTEFKLDIANEGKMIEIIQNCLVNYTNLLPKWRPLKRLTLDLPRRYVEGDIPSYFSTRSIKFLLVTSSLEEESSIIPFALHCAVHHPLARIEVFVKNLVDFKHNHDMILKLMNEVTSLSRDWLLLTQQSKEMKPTFIDESEFIISIDPRNMFVDEQLPNILLHLLGDKSAITLNNSSFGSASRLIGNVTIRRAHSFNNSNPLDVSNVVKPYKEILHRQLINVYAPRDKRDAQIEKHVDLVSELYSTQPHKLLQTMLPLSVPQFLEMMTMIETIFPKNILFK